VSCKHNHHIPAHDRAYLPIPRTSTHLCRRFWLQMRLDSHGKRIGGKEAEYQTPQSQKMVQDRTGTVMQIDLGAAMTQMSDMDTEMQQHEGCR
jgi:hypothetical protein